jgi:hypothetical protein
LSLEFSQGSELDGSLQKRNLSVVATRNANFSKISISLTSIIIEISE